MNVAYRIRYFGVASVVRLRKVVASPTRAKTIMGQFSLRPFAVTILDGNGGPDIGDYWGRGDIGAVLPGDESGPDFYIYFGLTDSNF